jgi:hypothetical protein
VWPIDENAPEVRIGFEDCGEQRIISAAHIHNVVPLEKSQAVAIAGAAIDAKSVIASSKMVAASGFSRKYSHPSTPNPSSSRLQ